nr:hypothetical protein SHINE37_44358 [Rhizobiaceae bacterium]
MAGKGLRVRLLRPAFCEYVTRFASKTSLIAPPPASFPRPRKRFLKKNPPEDRRVPRRFPDMAASIRASA